MCKSADSSCSQSVLVIGPIWLFSQADGRLRPCGLRDAQGLGARCSTVQVLASLNKGSLSPATGTCPQGHNHGHRRQAPLGRWAYPGRGIAMRPCRAGRACVSRCETIYGSLIICVSRKHWDRLLPALVVAMRLPSLRLAALPCYASVRPAGLGGGSLSP